MNAIQYNINDYVMLLLSDRRFLKCEYRAFCNNCYIIQNIEGIIRQDILNRAIRMAKTNRKVREMLSDILHYVDHSSISHENFRLLLSFRASERNTFLSNIGHADLAFYQMQIISQYPTTFEAFAWLFDKFCKYDFLKKKICFNFLKMLQMLPVLAYKHALIQHIRSMENLPN